MGRHKIRRVETNGTVSYQIGHYEMRGVPGYRHSVFKVAVHLGEYPTAGEALSAWSRDIARLQDIGRERKANTLQTKLNRLRELMEGEEDASHGRQDHEA